MRKTLLLTFGFAIAGMVVHFPSAWACSCVQVTPQQSFQQAQAVFTGTVESTDRSPQRTVVRFAVDAVYKGVAAQSTAIVTESGTRAVNTCDIDFVVGSRYAVFGHVEGGNLRAQSCSGTTTDVGTLARAGHSRPLLTYDAVTGSPSGAPAKAAGQGRIGAMAGAALLVAMAGGLLFMRARGRRSAAARR